ncbi:peptidase M23 [Lentibacter sp. XHP0401]|jgi:hypothetical protein|uniref:peptidase M23 n=1 Tax=Lentibacter sp. XHP0401 TaxID=2984334 RepID=UPI0021E85561|nr:peptidase M23 [Lentibacter sp. XHP0401]MCV2891953.1 peptidase M23 [Lentibacter sp. XHP0401]
MKYILITLTVLAANPVWAHVGTHSHPHGSDPSWILLSLAGAVVVAVGTALAMARRK